MRVSGTERKMNFRVFASELVTPAAALPAAKQRARENLHAFRALTEADLSKRAQDRGK